MGFGITFIGYLFTVFDMGFLVNNTLSVLVTQILTLLGYTVMLVGVDKLSVYIRRMRWAKAALYALIPCACVNLATQALWYTDAISDESMAAVRGVVFILLALLYAALHYFFLFGLLDIAKETDCPKVERKVRISLSFTAVFAFLNLIASLQISGLNDILAAPRYMLYVIITLINAATIFSAYMWICLEEDLDMKPKERKKRRERGTGK